jgi:hypothetical protein
VGLASSASPVERRLQISGVLIILGLLVEALCLAWRGTLAFLVFLGLGGLLLFTGIVFFLFSLVSIPQSGN